MRKFIICSYCLVLICVTMSFVVLPIMSKRTTATDFTNNETYDNSLSYIVKDFNGNVAVFESDSDVPFKVTQVCTNTLPRVDQEKLLDGIKVNSQVELHTLLEDLCS